MVRIILLYGFILLSSLSSYGQFARVTLSKKEVYVEQPIKVKITVYSPTWFAEPLNIGNLQMSGAFIQSFSQTRPGVTKINNKQYATLDFHYILFPIKDGTLVFPELSIKTSIPPEGDFRGVPVTITTKPVDIMVKPIPSTADADSWLVASNVTISETWSANLSELQVGDVVNRSVIIRASGTLPSFIDPPDIKELDFATIYNSEPEFIDDRTTQGANGRRIDNFSYLMETVGEFTIPAVEVTWYNPYTNRSYSKRLPSHDLKIAENTSLQELTHLRDSLNSLNQPLNMLEVEEGAEIDYVVWAKILLLGLLLLIGATWLIKLLIRLKNLITERRDQYLKSESYAFHQVLKVKSGTELLNSAYHFIDTRSTGNTSTIHGNMAGNEDLLSEFNKIQRDTYSSENVSYSLSGIKSLLRNWRKKSRPKGELSNDSADLRPLNPS